MIKALDEPDDINLELRLLAGLDKSPDCWRWRGSCQPNGYGRIYRGKGVSPAYVHRVAHELWIGPIPRGFHVHHRCGNRDCCRADHLTTLSPKGHAAIHRYLHSLKHAK